MSEELIPTRWRQLNHPDCELLAEVWLAHVPERMTQGADLTNSYLTSAFRSTKLLLLRVHGHFTTPPTRLRSHEKRFFASCTRLRRHEKPFSASRTRLKRHEKPFSTPSIRFRRCKKTPPKPSFFATSLSDLPSKEGTGVPG